MCVYSNILFYLNHYHRQTCPTRSFLLQRSNFMASNRCCKTSNRLFHSLLNSHIHYMSNSIIIRFFNKNTFDTPTISNQRKVTNTLKALTVIINKIILEYFLIKVPLTFPISLNKGK